MSVLTFLAIVSGAALAVAWHMLMPPVFARVAASRFGAALRSRTALGLLLLLPFAAIAVTIAMNGAGLRGAAAPPSGGTASPPASGAPHDIDSAVATLEAKLAKNPDDQEGWRLLERSYADLGETAKAEDAARHAAALGAVAGDAASQSARGEDLVTAAGGKVGPDARQAFEAALAVDPAEPRARFFLGLAAAQDGKSDEALARWLALEKDSPPDAPWLKPLRSNIDRLAQQAGLSADELARRRQQTGQ
jgi:cytochrome c-type biogenesis protein CcmH